MSCEDGRLYSLWLSLVLEPAAPRAGELLAVYGGPQAVYEAKDREDLGPWLGKGQLARLHALPLSRAEELLETLSGQGIGLLACTDEDYPAAFWDLASPPLALYYTGQREAFSAAAPVGIVGARRPSAYGIQAVQAIGAALAEAGCVLVSGLADGLDAEAHRAALAANRPTLAFLGNPIDTTYPSNHRALRAAIEQTGAAVSEYPPGFPCRPVCFLQRNRLIAAFSRALCVAEARAHSGTLNTVSHAAACRRPVFAVPGSVFSPLSEGTNALLEKGEASLLPRDAAPVLALLGLAVPGQQAEGASPPALSPEAKAVLALLRPTPLAPDELAGAGLPAGALLAALTELDLAGLVSALPGRRYQLK